MKTIITALFVICMWGCKQDGLNNKNYVNKYDDGFYIVQQYALHTNRILVKSGESVETCIWHKRSIKKVWYDDYTTMTDSLKLARIAEAKSLIEKYKNQKDTFIYIK